MKKVGMEMSLANEQKENKNSENEETGMSVEQIKEVLGTFINEDGVIDIDKASEALLEGFQPILDELEELKKKTGDDMEEKKDPFAEILAKYEK